MTIKKLLVGTCACALLSISTAHAENEASISNKHDHSTHSHTVHRADGHAPIGVMGDHMHSKGEWMLSYRFKQMQMDGNRDGTDDLSDAEILATQNRFGTPPNLRVIPEKMTGQTHMIGGMYAPTDWLTFMTMVKYIDKEMKTSTYNMPGVKIGESTMNSSGWGDTTVGGMIRVYDDGKHHVHLNAGVSLPTGSIKERDTMLMPNGMRNNMRLAYGMQLGSGTYDLLPGITYFANDGDKLGWGAQYKSTLRLGDNSEDYSFGNKHIATAWGSYSFVPEFSASLRVTAETEDDIDGIDSQIMGASQSADPDNYGGKRVSAGLGLNYIVPKGSLEGHRLSAEVTLPVYQDLNGPQMKRDNAFVLGWSKSF